MLVHDKNNKKKGKKKWIAVGVASVCIIGFLAIPVDSDNTNEAETEFASEFDTEISEEIELAEAVNTDIETVSGTTEINSEIESLTESTIIEETSSEFDLTSETDTSDALLVSNTLTTFESSTEQTAVTPSSETSDIEQTTVTPSSETSDVTSSTVNNNGSNFNTYDNQEQRNTTDTYVLNTAKMKIHRPSCHSVAKIAPQNYSTSSLSIAELQAQGYTTCGNCFK